MRGPVSSNGAPPGDAEVPIGSEVPIGFGSPKVVAIGGGTGLPVVLEGLKHLLFTGPTMVPTESEQDCLTAIVTVTDDGGSSGRPRQAYAGPPPGDIRDCLIHGHVFPSTTESVRLRAELANGNWVVGQSQIGAVQVARIRRVSLEPEQPEPFSGALAAILRSDLVVLGPGSLYTSVIPVLLVSELADAIRRSGARVVLVMNLTTEPGETDGYTAVDHLLAVRRHAPDVPIHDVVLNATPVPDELVQAYAAAHARLVAPDVELLRALGHPPFLRDLLDPGPGIRHDATKLGLALMELAHRGRIGAEVHRFSGART